MFQLRLFISANASSMLAAGPPLKLVYVCVCVSGAMFVFFYLMKNYSCSNICHSGPYGLQMHACTNRHTHTHISAHTLFLLTASCMKAMCLALE